MATIAELAALAKKPAPYADVFDLIGNPNVGYMTGSAGGMMGGGEGGGYQTGATGGGEGGGGFSAEATPFQYNYSPVDDKARALIDKYGQNMTANPLDSQYGGVVYDWSKLPNGGNVQWSGGMGMHPGEYAIDQFMPVNDETRGKLENQDAVIHDPNFGDITPLNNAKVTATDKLAMALPKVAVAALTAGAGAIGFPAMALSGVNAAQTLGNGGTAGQVALSMAPGLIGGALGGQFGNMGGLGSVGGSLASNPNFALLMKMLPYLKAGGGLYSAVKSENPAAAVGPGISLAQLGSGYFGGGK